MSLLQYARRLLVTGSALVLLSSAADAQVRYIASTGNDSGNNCQGANAPCRTLQRGIVSTPVGGELRILNSGFYGNGGLINKSMTISADGESVMLNAPLTIDATGAAVTLRGLSLNGHYTAAHGIHIVNAAAVHLDECRVEHAQGVGILSESNNMRLFVNDSVSRENRGRGLHMAGTATRLTVDNSRFENNSGSGIAAVNVVGSVTRTVTADNLGDGIVWNNGQLNVAWSMATDNYGHGYSAFGTGRIYLESSVARGNRLSGFYMSGDAATISNFVATGNGAGIHNHYGTLYSRQNNTVAGNTTNINGNQPVALPPI
jgi:hypothetical protein